MKKLYSVFSPPILTMVVLAVAAMTVPRSVFAACDPTRQQCPPQPTGQGSRPNLTLQVMAPSTAALNYEVNYQFLVQNTGPAKASAVKVRHYLPSGTTEPYMTVMTPSSWYCFFGFESSKEFLQCTGPLPASMMSPITIDISAVFATIGQKMIKATVDPFDEIQEWPPLSFEGDNTDMKTITVLSHQIP